ncbi:MAG TPA: hypothetical protein VIK52_14625 [Opitutaceae bacterium]
MRRLIKAPKLYPTFTGNKVIVSLPKTGGHFLATRPDGQDGV